MNINDLIVDVHRVDHWHDGVSDGILSVSSALLLLLSTVSHLLSLLHVRLWPLVGLSSILHPWLYLYRTDLHGPAARLLSNLSLWLLLLGPAGSGNLVGGHETTWLSNRHQVVRTDHIRHAGVAGMWADKAARDALRPD